MEDDVANQMPLLAPASAASLPTEAAAAPSILSESDKTFARSRMATEDAFLLEQQKQRVRRYLELLQQERRGLFLEPKSPLSLDGVDCSDMPELANMSDSDSEDEASLNSDDDDVPALVGEDGCWEDEPFVRAPGAGVVHNVQYTTRNIATAFQSHLLTTGGIPMSYDYACQAPASQYSVVCQAKFPLKHSTDGEWVERGWAINPLSRSKL
ncbi:hypothetical protein C8R47DRAFT_1225565 [Mycena vitilis]|nr:hypothetical protein C8R47DRAFT_1225565 [Mycena vitilis]